MGGGKSTIYVTKDCLTELTVNVRRHAAEVNAELHYRELLRRVEAEVDARIRLDRCPKSKLSNYSIKGKLDEGCFGEILLVCDQQRNRYALKVMAKLNFTDDTKHRPYFEKRVMYALRSDFLLAAKFAFHDSKNLYLGMEYAQYGDLVQVVGKIKCEATLKYMAAQIILGLEYLHACQIAHRDLKPDNILIFEDYYLKITDFGVSSKIIDRSWSLCGTEIYMAPEMKLESGHGKSVDWWSVGIIIFGIWYGYHPFQYPKTPAKSIIEAMLNKPVYWRSKTGPDTSPLNRLLNGLLQKSTTERLGCNDDGVDAIKAHPWFDNIYFSDVFDRRVRFRGNLKTTALKKAPHMRSRMNSNPVEFKRWDPDWEKF